MQLDRRSMIQWSAYGGLSVALTPFSSWQAVPPDQFDIIAAVLRPKAELDENHPVLIATRRFGSDPMSVASTPPTPIQKAMHQPGLPYLIPPPEHIVEARDLAVAYNLSLEHPAPPISKNAVFDFPHRLLDDALVMQFEALYPGGNIYNEEIEKKRRAVSSRYRLFFDGSTTVWSVSRVAFASGGLLAVVGLASSGGSCSSEIWKVLERSGDIWHALPWGAGQVTCA